MEVDMAGVYHRRNPAAKHQARLCENLSQFDHKRGVDYTLL